VGGVGAKLKDPQKSVEIVSQLLHPLGGSFESVYLAFDEYDIVAIMDVPDNVTAAAISMVVSAGGSVKAIKTTPLMTIDEAIQAIVVAAVQRINQDNRWHVPLKSYKRQNSKQATTLYASDRDLFVFLVDEARPIELQRWWLTLNLSRTLRALEEQAVGAYETRAHDLPRRSQPANPRAKRAEGLQLIPPGTSTSCPSVSRAGTGLSSGCSTVPGWRRQGGPARPAGARGSRGSGAASAARPCPRRGRAPRRS
jgi:uncharacterized protein with GYD domain